MMTRYVPTTSIIAWIVAIGIIGGGSACKTTETTRHASPDDNPTEPRGDIQATPVTIFPNGEARVPSGAERDGGFSGPDATPATRPSGDPGRYSRSGDVWIPDEGDFVLRDRETGSLWNLRGEAFRGPMKGETLDQVPSFNSFWFAWSVFYHGSQIWQRDGSRLRNTPGPIKEGTRCRVPCNDIRLGCNGKDCIPALDYKGRPYAGTPRPSRAEMVEPGAEGTSYLDEDDFVFGVVVDGEARAYPHNIYWRHEIHNDAVGDREYTVTFCPLTGSGIVFEGRHQNEPIRFGVSGRLYNANLIMFDPSSGTFWSQMLGMGIKGPHIGETLTRLPVVETTWERWREMYPETLVTSSETGYGGGYERYPYGDYRTDHDRTFGADAHQETYNAKERVLGLPGETKRSSLAVPFPEMKALEGDRNVIHMSFEGEPIVIVYETEHRMAIPYRRTVEGRELTFTGMVMGEEM